MSFLTDFTPATPRATLTAWSMAAMPGPVAQLKACNTSYLGVRRIVGPCAAGSLQPHVHPGEMVVCDQLVDRTWGRSDTFFDGAVVGHTAFAGLPRPTL